ncbi:MAG: hypothetical protein KBS98_05385 [Flavobacterium sp.]|nr:hypothetical protein [Candidatus Neoflavobacterium equi]
MPISNVFCLHGVPDIEQNTNNTIINWLEQLAFNYGITNVYKDCDSIEGFEESLQTLIYEDRAFNDYKLLYFVFKGRDQQIEIDNYYYTFEEIAEVFEGKLTDKIIHFANTINLDLDVDQAQYFLDITGARALSGYNKNAPILSTVLDAPYFNLCQEEHDDVIDLVEHLHEKHYALCVSMGFVLYY